MHPSAKQFLTAFLFGIAAASAAAAVASPAISHAEFIYEKAPFPACHASTIVEVSPGRLAAAWFGGTAERNPDVCIWVSRREANGWTAPREVANGVRAEGPRMPTWNPVLFQPGRGGPLMLFYKVGANAREWWGELRTSQDGGDTWGPARRLPKGILGPIKNKPLELADGTILCPTSLETTKPSLWRVYFERTSDYGVTWDKTPFVNDGSTIAAIQPSLLRLGGSRLMALGRTKQGQVFSIASGDDGRTWGTMSLTSLPNPNSGTDAVTLADGRHLLVYNHAKKGRTPLNVAVSTDGADWKTALELESAPGEYSYPAIIQTADGLVHITYTWRREKIRHVVLDPKRL